MKVRSYKHLASIKRKISLVQRLIEATEDKLPKTVVQAIVNHTWVNTHEKLALVDQLLEIVVCESIEDFALSATLNFTGTISIGLGSNTLTEYGNWIVGDGTFGSYTNIRYPIGSEPIVPDMEQEEPDFSCDQTQVIAVKSIDHDSYKHYPPLHTEKWYLFILLVNTPVQIDVTSELIASQYGLMA